MNPEAGEVAMFDAKRNNALLHDMPSMSAADVYGIDDDLLEALLDPMAPIDFGSIDLDQITGVTQQISTSEGDFGVVPIEPIRDGMVPQLQDHIQTNAPLPVPLTITTGSTHPIVISLGQQKEYSELPRHDQMIDSGIITTNTPITTGDTVKEEIKNDEEVMPDHHPGRREKRQKTSSYHSKGPGRGQIFEDFRKREDIIARWREKKARRTFNRPKVQYESRKRTALVKCRVNGKFVTPEIFKAHQEAQEKSANQSLHTVPVAAPAAPDAALQQ